MRSPEMIKFEKAINALKLPEKEWIDFHYLWMELKGTLPKPPSGKYFMEKDAVKEQARQYAESKMNGEWDRKDHINLGIFYQHFTDFILSPTTLPEGRLSEIEFAEWILENGWQSININQRNGETIQIWSSKWGKGEKTTKELHK